MGNLRKLPANRNKIARFKGKPFDEQIALVRPNQDKTIATQTVNNALTRISSMFQWAYAQGMIDRNPAQGRKLTDRRKTNEQRDRFADDELTRLASGYVFDRSLPLAKNTALHAYCFWLIPIGLYSGMRLNEICQLHLADIRQDNGIWVFDINENAPDKKLKNVSSKRLVPIHPALQQIGIIDFAEQQQKLGYARLFPELVARRDGYGHDASKWFARYRKACGIVVKDGSKSFHSLRHTFADQARQLQLPGDQVSRILGHALEGMTATRYAKEFNPVLLFETISKISFPSVEPSKLSFTEYQKRKS